MYSIKWEIRRLQHVHILIGLIQKVTPDQIDQIILTEIPDVGIDPELFEVVTKTMIHGLCGLLNKNSLYMSDGKCTKRYQKDLLAKTITGNDRYPLYRRRSTENEGKSITLKVRNNDVEVDNRWVIPYSLLARKRTFAKINKRKRYGGFWVGKCNCIYQ